MSYGYPFHWEHALGPPLRASHARQESGVFDRCHPLSHARHRRQRDDLQLRPRPAPPPIPISRARRGRGDRRVEPEARLAHELPCPTRTSGAGRPRIAASRASGIYTGASFNLATGDGADYVQGGTVSWTMFHVLGISPALGRDFREDEDRVGAPKVIILSDRIWRDRFEAKPRRHRAIDHGERRSAHRHRRDADGIRVPGDGGRVDDDADRPARRTAAITRGR